MGFRIPIPTLIYTIIQKFYNTCKLLQDFDFESFPFHIFSNKPKTLNPLVLADDVDDPFLSFSCSLNLICVNMPTYVCMKYCVVISQGKYYYVSLFHEKKKLHCYFFVKLKSYQKLINIVIDSWRCFNVFDTIFHCQGFPI